MKVDVFVCDDVEELQKQMNSWFKDENPNVKHVKVLQGPVERITVLVFYED
jgi:hypothetical protein